MQSFLAIVLCLAVQTSISQPNQRMTLENYQKIIADGCELSFSRQRLKVKECWDNYTTLWIPSRSDQEFCEEQSNIVPRKRAICVTAFSRHFIAEDKPSDIDSVDLVKEKADSFLDAYKACGLSLCFE